MMKHFSSIITAGLLLVGCGSGDHSAPHAGVPVDTIKDYRSVNPKNGIDFYAIKDNRNDPNCFYMGNGKMPPWDSRKYKAEVVPVIIGSNFNGIDGYQRLEFTPPAQNQQGFTRQDFDQLVEAGNLDELEAQLTNLGDEFFSARPLNDIEAGIAQRVGKPAPNPLDISLPYHARIVFILRSPSQTFDPKTPFRVAVGVPKAVSPFYGPPKRSNGNKVLDVRYLSLPERKELAWDYVKKRDCIYYYELNVVQKYTDANGRDLEVIITIDPDGEGNGDPPFGQPPSWP